MEDYRSFYIGKSVLITGGLGHIGSNLAHALVTMGAKVTIVDNMSPMYGGNLFNLEGIQEQVWVNFADIRDQDVMNLLVRDQDVIFNLAAQVSYIDSNIEPFLDLDINCRGHLVMLEACRTFNPDVKILFSGSRMQYGRIQSIPVDENHPMEPRSIYGIHKLAGEKYHLMYHRVFDLRPVVFRIANPYGPRHQMKHAKYGIVNYFIKLAMQDKTIRVFGEGKQFRDYIYVEDIVCAFLAAGARPEAEGQVFNIGSGTGTMFCDMAQEVCEVVGSGHIEHVEWPDNYERVETGDYVADISKARALLGWAPHVGLREGIALTWSYYEKYGQHYVTA